MNSIVIIAVIIIVIVSSQHMLRDIPHRVRCRNVPSLIITALSVHPSTGGGAFAQAVSETGDRVPDARHNASVRRVGCGYWGGGEIGGSGCQSVDPGGRCGSTVVRWRTQARPYASTWDSDEDLTSVKNLEIVGV